MITYVARSVHGSLQTLSQMERWRAITLYVFLFSVAALVGYIAIFRWWYTVDTLKLMEDKFALERRNTELDIQNRDLSRRLTGAEASLEQNGKTSENSKKLLQEAREALAKERGAKVAAERKLADAAAAQKSLEEQLAEARKRENPDAVTEAARIARELAGKEAALKKATGELAAERERDRVATAELEKKLEAAIALGTSRSAQITDLERRLKSGADSYREGIVARDDALREKDRQIASLQEKLTALARDKDAEIAKQSAQIAALTKERDAMKEEQKTARGEPQAKAEPQPHSGASPFAKTEAPKQNKPRRPNVNGYDYFSGMFGDQQSVRKSRPAPKAAQSKVTCVSPGRICHGGYTSCSSVRTKCNGDTDKAYPTVCSDRYSACVSTGCWRSNNHGSICGLLKR